jgi:predicted tellurium resistance membrane protein TerC
MEIMHLLTDPHAWVAFATLTMLELVLGIDNIVFISILVDKLPPEQRRFARRLGLFLAMFMRIALLLAIAWLAGLTAVWFHAFGHGFSGRDVVLALGGAFLLWKSVKEVHQLLEGDPGESSRAVGRNFAAIIVQIVLIDLVFSLDSIITAVGMVDETEIMIAAIVVSVGLMMAFSGAISRFISAHPSMKLLALGFLFVIGVVLVADGFGHHLPKGYVYGAMAFALTIELLNIRMRKASRAAPVDLHEAYEPESQVERCPTCGTVRQGT